MKDLYNIKNYISKEHKHYLYQDELGDTFLITRYCEIFINSKTTCKVWSNLSPKRFRDRFKGVKIDDLNQNDDFYEYVVNLRFLPVLIACGGMKKRPHLKGRWIKSREGLFGHKILPYRPALESAI